MYISIEGVDTAGKSTQLKLLKNLHSDFLYTKEPGGCELGELIRDIALNKTINSPKAEMLLFLADRAEHYKEVIEKNRDKIVISDRSFISGIAYAKEFEIDFLLKLNSFALDNFKLDAVIFLKLNYDELKSRLESKTQDRIEKKGLEYIWSLQNRIEDVIDRIKCEKLVIDASKKVDEISQEIDSFIQKIRR